MILYRYLIVVNNFQSRVITQFEVECKKKKCMANEKSVSHGNEMIL